MVEKTQVDSREIQKWITKKVKIHFNLEAIKKQLTRPLSAPNAHFWAIFHFHVTSTLELSDSAESSWIPFTYDFLTK